MLKRSRFEAAGVPSYWVVDPDEPSLLAWRLVDGAYQQVAEVSGDRPFSTDEPYALEVVPARLVSNS